MYQNRKKRILIVEDDPDIVEVLQVMLEDSGYQVETSYRGDEVESLDENHLPDLIVLDVLIYGKDGRELATKLKSQQYTQHIPILMISAHPLAEGDARAMGVEDFLAKPFEMDDFLAKVEQCLQQPSE
jgi:DNA-binding response OmpR family regulator